MLKRASSLLLDVIKFCYRISKIYLSVFIEIFSKKNEFCCNSSRKWLYLGRNKIASILKHTHLDRGIDTDISTSIQEFKSRILCVQEQKRSERQRHRNVKDRRREWNLKFQFRKKIWFTEKKKACNEGLILFALFSRRRRQ